MIEYEYRKVCNCLKCNHGFYKPAVECEEKLTLWRMIKDAFGKLRTAKFKCPVCGYGTCRVSNDTYKRIIRRKNNGNVDNSTAGVAAS